MVVAAVVVVAVTGEGRVVVIVILAELLAWYSVFVCQDQMQVTSAGPQAWQDRQGQDRTTQDSPALS